MYDNAPLGAYIIQTDKMRHTYIGTISITPRITVSVVSEGLILFAPERRSLMSPYAVKKMIMLLLAGSTPSYIPSECAKAAINVLLRGLSRLGEDTTQIQQDVDKDQQRGEDEGRGVYPEKAEPIGDDY